MVKKVCAFALFVMSYTSVASAELTTDKALNKVAVSWQNYMNSLKQYSMCITETAELFSLLDDPAATAAKGVRAFCRTKREDAQQFLTKVNAINNPDTSVEISKNFMDDLAVRDEEFALGQIMALRVEAKMKNLKNQR